MNTSESPSENLGERPHKGGGSLHVPTFLSERLVTCIDGLPLLLVIADGGNVTEMLYDPLRQSVDLGDEGGDASPGGSCTGRDGPPKNHFALVGVESRADFRGSAGLALLTVGMDA